MIGQFSLPITRWYQRHASGLIGSPTVPSSRSVERSCRLGHASPKRISPRIAVGRAVEHVDAVLLDHAPPAVRVGVGRRAFVHEARRPDQQRRIDDVRVAGDPARVGGAPVAVVFFQVEHRLECGPHAHHVAAVGVQDRLGLAGRAGGVEHEERVLGVHHLGVAAVPAAGRARHRQPHQLVPPVVAPLLHRHLMAGALEDDDVLDGRRALAAPRPRCASARRSCRSCSCRRR